MTSPPRLGAPPAPWSCAAVGLWASAVPPSRAAESLAAMSALTGGDAAALVDRARDALDALETLPQIETVPLWWAVLILMLLSLALWGLVTIAPEAPSYY